MKAKYSIWDFQDVWPDEDYIFWSDLITNKTKYSEISEIMNSNEFKDGVINQTASGLIEKAKNNIESLVNELSQPEINKLKLLNNDFSEISKIVASNIAKNMLVSDIKGLGGWISKNQLDAMSLFLNYKSIQELGIKFDNDGFWVPNKFLDKSRAVYRPCILIKDNSELDDSYFIVPLTSQNNEVNNVAIEIEKNKQYIVISKLQRINKNYLRELSKEHYESTNNVRQYLSNKKNIANLEKSINDFIFKN